MTSPARMTGLPAIVDAVPTPGDSVVLRALRSHAARCTSCRDVALCPDGRSLVEALKPGRIRGVRVVYYMPTEERA